MYVISKYYATSYKGLEHQRVLVSSGRGGDGVCGVGGTETNPLGQGRITVCFLKSVWIILFEYSFVSGIKMNTGNIKETL